MKLFYWGVLFVCFLFHLTAYAEGRCPPGQYPIGDSRAPGCAPIPGYGRQAGSAEGTVAPLPAGEWLKTWGAVAHSPSTDLIGVSVGERSKEEAEQVALNKCAAEGDRNCKISLSYRNQCVAIVTPSSGKGAGGIASAPTEQEALSEANTECSDAGGGRCVRFYSDCSKPIFMRY